MACQQQGPRRRSAAGIRSVLVRLPNWVGDAVMATCVLRAVRRGAPEAQLSVAGRAKLEELLSGSGLFDSYIPLRTGTFRESLRLGLGLRLRGSADLALILPNSFRSAILPFVAGARTRVGYEGQGRRWLLTHPVPLPAKEGWRRVPEPMPVYWRRLVEAAALPWSGDAPQLAVSDRERRTAQCALRSLGIGSEERLVGLSPGASFGPSKLWAPERFAQVAEELFRQLGLRAIALVGPGEEHLAEAVASAAPSVVVSTAAAPLGLGECKAVLLRCTLLVSTDNGIRHIGVALGIPTVTIIGPTDLRYTAYCLEKQEVVSAAGIECLGCHRPVCPTDHRCMERVTSAEVVKRALQLLERAGSAR